MSYQTLLLEIEAGICTITINRPEKLNALNRNVFDDLEKAIDEIIANSDVKSVILTGAGPKAFVAGADIAEFAGFSKEKAMALALRGQEVFFKIENCTKPVIAAVNGFALGGGCELAMACHFRLCSDNAKFGQPEVNLGLIPGYGGTQRLVQLVGKGKAMELLMSAQLIDAAEAKALGLVNYVTIPESLLDKAKQILTVINSKAPLAVAACIKSANAVFDESLNGFTVEVEQFAACFDSTDMIEGTTAFLEKRPATFTGK